MKENIARKNIENIEFLNENIENLKNFETNLTIINFEVEDDEIEFTRDFYSKIRFTLNYSMKFSNSFIILFPKKI